MAEGSTGWRNVNGFWLAPWATPEDIQHAQEHKISSGQSAASQNWGAGTSGMVSYTPTGGMETTQGWVDNYIQQAGNIPVAEQQALLSQMPYVQQAGNEPATEQAALAKMQAAGQAGTQPQAPTIGDVLGNAARYLTTSPIAGWDTTKGINIPAGAGIGPFSMAQGTTIGEGIPYPTGINPEWLRAYQTWMQSAGAYRTPTMQLGNMTIAPMPLGPMGAAASIVSGAMGAQESQAPGTAQGMLQAQGAAGTAQGTQQIQGAAGTQTAGTQQAQGIWPTYAKAVGYVLDRGYRPRRVTTTEAKALAQYVFGSDQSLEIWLTQNGYRYDATLDSYILVDGGLASGGYSNSGSYGGGGGGRGGGGGGRKSGYSYTLGLINWRV